MRQGQSVHRPRKCWICHCGGGDCRLLLLLTFGLELVLQLLHVAVGVVLQGWLRGLPFRVCLLSWRFLPGRTEQRRHYHEQCGTQINESLEVLLQDTFW
jgi:hypothetical protein